MITTFVTDPNIYLIAVIEKVISEQADHWRVSCPMNKVPRAWQANEHNIAHLQAKTIPMNFTWSEKFCPDEQTNGWTKKQTTNGRRQFHGPPFFLQKGRGTKIVSISWDATVAAQKIFPPLSVTPTCSKWPARSWEILQHLTHWGRDNMAAILQTTLSIAFSWIKMLQFQLNLHLSLFQRVHLTLFQHWFR